ncbi:MULTISPECIES: hypothetical protein [unclassified Arenibacter]|uniref:hypothetical protein n=1 Tax=unclassified Arenibacter TaxID=2615047 RepID=UPI000E3539DF|nr:MULTISPECIES: hypothetical protein [unclassified Arenibacter]MCM4165284.1 hypothetical protein [Arenibacter sp. A80]RFT55212.1 hypothetical protein D0S24_16925 [Arenibacter sp. P308M17]
MKKNEVPQDKSNLESANFKELCYAVDENGEYTTELSTGWSPKTIALNNAIEALNERIAASKQRVRELKASPLEYYMELHKMDLPILASYVGIWKWRVKRHFRPAVFNNLNNKTLQKYADVFEVTIEELKRTDL